MNQGQEALSYIGFVVTAVMSVTGAWIWLRWGFCGVVHLWARRKSLDYVVTEEMDETLEEAGVRRG